ncbi:MAG TPA: hypothetical protein DCZ59_11220, partial [Bacteroidetes bacterium]|nr:hypothetical protein [Bacteroidota bacterium]
SQNSSQIYSGGVLGNYVQVININPDGSYALTGGLERQIHIALLGDPTLRSNPKQIAALGTLTAKTEFPNKVKLSWIKPSGTADAYMV